MIDYMLVFGSIMDITIIWAGTDFCLFHNIIFQQSTTWLANFSFSLFSMSDVALQLPKINKFLQLTLL